MDVSSVTSLVVERHDICERLLCTTNLEVTAGGSEKAATVVVMPSRTTQTHHLFVTVGVVISTIGYLIGSPSTVCHNDDSSRV